MCADPATLMAIAKIGGQVVSFAAQQEQADRTNDRNAAARLQITQARDDKIRQQALKESQEKAKLAQEKTDRGIEALELSSRAALSAGEAGVGGRLVNAIMTKYERDRLTTNTTLTSDIESLALQGTFDRKGIESEAQSQINQYQPVQGPSALGLMANVAMSKAEYDQDIAATT